MLAKEARIISKGVTLSNEELTLIELIDKEVFISAHKKLLYVICFEITQNIKDYYVNLGYTWSKEESTDGKTYNKLNW